ncbi:uncharacterized protein FTJAE_2516 [Fusarium tjaetaba]|uniref:Uncharacterized protein n=1 Tax=Fusarium tjaetaba TaxID=1567544 RepID=A0A8H5S2C6_9HYPO|nr:uncharacterized protein FTJAE_2516 [Fusarium tjaetaba]KAF5645266.1 hypothetical protein FTJAE_2516 [Fusarium tjaetaba]
MAKKSKPTLRERKALQALQEQSAPALAPPSTEVDMADMETPLDQQDTLEEFDASREIAAIKTRLDRQDGDTEENRELITIAGAKIFELEPVVNKMEDEFPDVKEKLRACKKTLDGFSDDLDDMARVDSAKWSRINDREDNAQLKADMASIMRRLAAIEDVVLPDMCEAAEKKFGQMGVSDTQ